ncbi:transposase [Caldicellulosiruptor saccharolyticus DSM 8903]|uniref:Transposase n=1 Tax=Caldicellulosiruptor saccharolyticus (strain ATCC 43494 / DSM 8903 / Tp8T 6331) TaxID=351627 RepID=A4XI29_CALS8|nr:IS481-like element ISCsa6 family transposase [Caldicellulosiruptor saccharolyticus]ABP66564.1 transposase [Caldicellulosiruptor saccharolyticus DSM 8903]
MNIISYHELRKISPQKARELVRKVFESNNKNVSKTAKILGVSRHTVRRAVYGPLEDKSKKPKSSPKKLSSELENFIVEESKKTGFRYRRLSFYLLRKYGIKISENTIKSILRRNSVARKTKRTKKGERSLYDYETLIPFSEFQLDTKHLLDKESLPKEVYEHMKRYNLPCYEWNIIDVATRTRFTAYSYELSSAFGFMFISLVALWLRTHNVRNIIKIRLDNGAEFCGGSERKLKQWNEMLSFLGVELNPIPPKAKHLMGIIENSHRADDEYFLMIHAERCKTKDEFIQRAQKWQDTWNFFRPHNGKGMNGRTPFEKFIASKSLVSSHIFQFPTLLLEDIMKKVGTFYSLFCNKFGGKYVFTTYLKKFFVYKIKDDHHQIFVVIFNNKPY